MDFFFKAENENETLWDEINTANVPTTALHLTPTFNWIKRMDKNFNHNNKKGEGEKSKWYKRKKQKRSQ